MTQATITLCIPLNDANALNRGSLMLSGLANDATSDAHIDTMQPAAPTPNLTSDSTPDPKTVFAAGTDNEETLANADTATVSPPAGDPVTTGNAPAPGAGDVELDNANFPWDERINTASKRKAAKDGRYIKIKNLDKNKPGLYDQVIAELTAAGWGPNYGSTPAAEQETATTAPAPAPAPTPTPGPVPAPAPVKKTVTKYIDPNNNRFTREQLVAAGWDDVSIEALQTVEEPVEDDDEPTVSVTFPELMALITPAQAAGTITQQQINDELAKHGLASLVLLSARPDLVPTVKQALFG